MCITPTEESRDWTRKACTGEAAKFATILFVEDEAFVRDATCEVLCSAGYAVLPARHAEEAVALYDGRCGEVDLLLSDVVLPGDSGLVLARKLRQRNPRLRTLFVSGYAEQMVALKTENEEWLEKPFSLDTLLDNMRRLLDTPDFSGTQRLVMPACESAPLA